MLYHQITFAERYTLGLLRQRGLSTAAIARLLHRHRSTIGREVWRNRAHSERGMHLRAGRQPQSRLGHGGVSRIGTRARDVRSYM